MDALIDRLQALSSTNRIILILVLAVTSHLLVLTVRRFGVAVLTDDTSTAGAFARKRPKFASMTSLFVSTATFGIYFGAIGLIFGELGISLRAYAASAGVIGLAVGFGAQGLVQDIVIGVTLILSDVIDVGDVADIGGQTGRVEQIGLRFTVMQTLAEQRVFIPNRGITQINRYRKGYIRAYVDVQLPDDAPRREVVDEVEAIARRMHSQHPEIMLFEPQTMGVQAAKPDGWSYLRIKFRIWPGQGSLIENTFRQRVLAAMRARVESYPDWMVVVTYRAEG